MGLTQLSDTFPINLAYFSVLVALGRLMFERSAKLKAMVGVDPPNETMTSVKEILETKGLGMGKVMILIGGPDWPTSVLTGILNLSYVQMLIGSLPVILLTGPTTGA